MLTLFFVPINFHRCWPREWKRSLEACNYQYRIFHLQSIQANRYNYEIPRYCYRKHWCDSYGCCSHTRRYLSRKAPNMKDVIYMYTNSNEIHACFKNIVFCSFLYHFAPQTVHSRISTPENVINNSPLYSFLVRKEALSQRSEWSSLRKQPTFCDATTVMVSPRKDVWKTSAVIPY